MPDTNNITVCAIAALANDRIIGKNGDIPWEKIKEDMKRFVQATKQKPVIMGRITLESIIEELGGPLPERRTVVVTSDPNYEQTLQDKFEIDLDNKPTIEVAHSSTESLKVAKELAKNNGQKKVCVAGGGSVYKALLPETDELVLTLIEKDIEVGENDSVTCFPPYEDKFTKKEIEAEHDKHKPSFTFVTRTRQSQT